MYSFFAVSSSCGKPGKKRAEIEDGHESINVAVVVRSEHHSGDDELEEEEFDERSTEIQHSGSSPPTEYPAPEPRLMSDRAQSPKSSLNIVVRGSCPESGWEMTFPSVILFQVCGCYCSLLHSSTLVQLFL